jgi:NAD/NADP transhydrogenase alpha subunit
MNLVEQLKAHQVSYQKQMEENERNRNEALRNASIQENIQKATVVINTPQVPVIEAATLPNKKKVSIVEESPVVTVKEEE